jgi:hypothetical protein
MGVTGPESSAYFQGNDACFLDGGAQSCAVEDYRLAAIVERWPHLSNSTRDHLFALARRRVK